MTKPLPINQKLPLDNPKNGALNVPRTITPIPITESQKHLNNATIMIKYKFMINKKPQKAAFSLLEMLTVTAIFALLAALFIPIAGKAMDSARKSTVASNLRQIALGYYSFLNSDDRQKFNAITSLHDFVGLLAEKADLNDPNLWIIKEDPRIERNSLEFPTYIIAANSQNGRWEINNAFKNFPLSITLAKGIPSNANPSTTPIAWTRGLEPNGRWGTEGVYGTKGGFIAFLDGHVKWYSNLTDNGGLLNHFLTHKPTSNILEALPAHTSVLD